MNRSIPSANAYKLLIVIAVIFLSISNVLLFSSRLVHHDVVLSGKSTLEYQAEDTTPTTDPTLFTHNAKPNESSERHRHHEIRTSWPTANLISTSNRRFQIQPWTYTNPAIQQQGCVITVVLMDPELRTTAFAALESVAENLHPIDRSCFLLQTSDCTVERHTEESYTQRAQNIYSSARPLFQKLMEAGNVRIHFINSTRYHQPSCDKFHPNNAWYNYFYWSDYQEGCVDCGEFIPGQDSDFVLMIQADTVLCHGLHVHAFQQFSYVGAPWPPHGGHWSCSILNLSWEAFHLNSNRTNAMIPPYPTQNEVCTNPALGPLGNGGLSLRSRYWMRQVIQYCPRPTLRSGIDFELFPPVCVPTWEPTEDVYFASILRGLFYNNFSVDDGTDHPTLRIPTMHEAALFSSETISLSHIIAKYQGDYPVDMVSLANQYWWNGTYSREEEDFLRKWDMYPKDTTPVEDGKSRFQRMVQADNGLVPIGLHKVWAYQNIMDSWRNECKYLRDISPR